MQLKTWLSVFLRHHPAGGITLAHTVPLAGADVYTLTSAAAAPAKGTALVPVATNAFSYAMPARSVSTLVFHP
jgi:hypothetical protein